MSAAHTPGLWEIDADDSLFGVACIPITAPDGQGIRRVCEVLGTLVSEEYKITEQDRANARLIITASQLFEEVRQAAIELAEAAVLIEERFPRTAALFSRAAERARGTLAKATGEA